MTTEARPRRKCDLHLHSTCSDGLWPPARVVEEAARCGVSILSLTDHDTTEGLDDAVTAGRREGAEVIPGVEISVDVGGGSERHVLAYGIDPSEPRLREMLAANVAARRERLSRMLDALAGVGMRLEAEDVLAHSHGAVGRPHVADALVRRGHARSRQEAFDRWLGDGKIAHVFKQNVLVDDALRAVHDAGGVAVLAHPGRRWNPAQLEDLVRRGLDGFEAWHPANSAEQARALEGMARRWGLLATGGSDCHGDSDGRDALRGQRVPVEIAEGLLERVALRARAARSGA